MSIPFQFHMVDKKERELKWPTAATAAAPGSRSYARQSVETKGHHRLATVATFPVQASM